MVCFSKLLLPVLPRVLDRLLPHAALHQRAPAPLGRRQRAAAQGQRQPKRLRSRRRLLCVRRPAYAGLRRVPAPRRGAPEPLLAVLRQRLPPQEQRRRQQHGQRRGGEVHHLAAGGGALAARDAALPSGCGMQRDLLPLRVQGEEGRHAQEILGHAKGAGTTLVRGQENVTCGGGGETEKVRILVRTLQRHVFLSGENMTCSHNIRRL